MDLGSGKKQFEENNSAYFASDRAGPGAYNLPALLGSFTMEANKRNHPSFSIGTQSRNQLLVL